MACLYTHGVFKTPEYFRIICCRTIINTYYETLCQIYRNPVLVKIYLPLSQACVISYFRLRRITTLDLTELNKTASLAIYLLWFIHHLTLQVRPFAVLIWHDICLKKLPAGQLSSPQAFLLLVAC